jgi:peptide deformylase
MSAIPIYNCYNPILKQTTSSITEITDEIKTLINDMFDTLRETSNGVGLAANQVGKSISLFIVDVSDIEEYQDTLNKMVFINPKIVSYSEEKNYYNEGCLSVPTFYEDVERPLQIEIEYYDAGMNKIIKKYDGFLSRVIQHEYDHLQGILFFERLSAFKRTLSKNKLRNIKSGRYEIDYNMIEADGKKHLQ